MQITVKVKPQAKENKVKKISDSIYRVSLTAPAIKNMANKQLIKVLAIHFKLKPSQILFKSGLKSKSKTIIILK